MKFRNEGRIAGFTLGVALLGIACARARPRPTLASPPSLSSRNLEKEASGQRFDQLIVHVRILPGPAAAASEEASDSAVGVIGSRIAAIGPSEDLNSRCTGDCQKIDGKGQFLLPGFQDSNARLVDRARAESDLRLGGEGLSTDLEVVRVYAEAHPEKSWILGGSWSPLHFSRSVLHREDLDRSGKARPVALEDSSGHQLWVSSAALLQAGINRESRDPPGGRIVRDERGDPTGLLLETATDPVRARMPPLSDELLRAAILRGQEIAFSQGVTTVQEGGRPVTLAQALTYASLEESGLLQQRSYLRGDLLAPEAEFRALVRFAKKRKPLARVRVIAFEGDVDGTLGSATAAMLEPYQGAEGGTGLLRIDTPRLNRLVLRANKAGFPVALHASGDRAVRLALDSFAFSKQSLGHSLPNRIEQVSLIDPTDLPRFKALGVIAAVQPAFAEFHSSADWASILRELGGERMKRLHAWRTWQLAGVRLIFGSADPESGLWGPDPIAGIHSAAHREFGDAVAFEPSESIDAARGLEAFTSAPAEAVGQGDRLGRIAPGYEADLLMREGDPRRSHHGPRSANSPIGLWVAGVRVR